jgi:DNA-binding response OmpR family regulator
MELRRRSPALRLLYLSGYTRDAISERSELDPGVEFLAKPFTRSGLLAKVRAILDAGR